MDDSRQFLEGRRPQDGEKAPKYAPIGYCDSKMMNEVYARELAKRHPEVSVISIGPGWCKTDLARNVDIPWYKKILLAPIALIFMRSADEGAQNIIHAVLEDSDQLESGKFYRDFNPSSKENAKVDELLNICDQFWSLSEEVVTKQKQQI
jgi:hypothetical protein